MGAAKSSSQKGEFMNDALFKGSQSADFYSPTDVQKYKMMSPMTTKIFTNTERKMEYPHKPNNLSPQTYKLEGKHMKMS